jgi:hypothetical protein
MKRPLKVALKFLITADIFVFEGDISAQSIMGRQISSFSKPEALQTE